MEIVQWPGLLGKPQRQTYIGKADLRTEEHLTLLEAGEGQKTPPYPILSFLIMIMERFDFWHR